MKIKKIFLFVFMNLLGVSAVYASAESAAKTVEALISESRALADSINDIKSFEGVIEKYMDFQQISGKVLAGVKKSIRDHDGDAQKAEDTIRAFLPEFVAVFKPYIVTKYATKEYLDKFKSMTPEISKRVARQGSLFIVRSTFKSLQGSLGDVKINWHVNTDNHVVDIVFEDAGASPLRIEASNANHYFNEHNRSLSELLGFYKKA
jgi:ABC-type transporter MlaC component